MILGISLALFTGSGIGFALILTGLLTGIISLAIKSEEGNGPANKKDQKVALWTVIVGGALVAIVIIALASWGGH